MDTRKNGGGRDKRDSNNVVEFIFSFFPRGWWVDLRVLKARCYLVHPPSIFTNFKIYLSLPPPPPGSRP
jgi:hypothetical protein